MSTKIYQNLTIGFKLQSKMSGMFFLRHSIVREADDGIYCFDKIKCIVYIYVYNYCRRIL